MLSVDDKKLSSETVSSQTQEHSQFEASLYEERLSINACLNNIQPSEEFAANEYADATDKTDVPSVEEVIEQEEITANKSLAVAYEDRTNQKYLEGINAICNEPEPATDSCEEARLFSDDGHLPAVINQESYSPSKKDISVFTQSNLAEPLRKTDTGEMVLKPDSPTLGDADDSPNGNSVKLYSALNVAEPGSPEYLNIPLIGRVKGHQRVPSGSGAQEFKENTKKDALRQLEHELERLLETSPESRRPALKKEYDGFARLFGRFLQEEGPSIDWDRIEKLPPDAIINHKDLREPSTDEIYAMLKKLVVIKLNGGLGTSMGCHGPKSVISVRSDLTFLDLTVQQIEHLNKKYKVNVPLVLMNSFNTDEDTQKIIRKYKGLQLEIYTFNQSCYPRINRDTLLPLATTSSVDKDQETWYPPGHGDFYESFRNSGLLKKFIETGREYCFISNIDNLGATVDLNILDLLLHPQAGKESPEFIMEVTDKTRADVKGGTLIYYENKLRLLEIAQVPKEHVDDFKSIKKFNFFNTNNLWASLSAIERVLEEQTLNMEVIINNKHLDNGYNVIQLETAVGAAMKCYNGCIGVNVPRSRFLPVKKTSDLMLVMSNLYGLKNGSLVMSPQRMFPTTPLVKLGDNHFSKVKDFLGRFATIPDMIELDHLTVSGDVTFGRNVSLKGTVIIIANHGDRIDIPSGACLENKIVSGNLRILDH